MYSIFFSRIELGINNVCDELSKLIKANYKVAIFPWAFPNEINSDKLMNDYFKKGSIRYNKYINSLKKIGIKEENITVCDCYLDTCEKLRKIINDSDILLLPGGNPEMFFKNVVHDTEILYDIKHYKGIIIGESAGAVLQFKRYFITAKNNYYKYFAFYDGFGVINDPFYIDVHSSTNKNYIRKLESISYNSKKDIYAIGEDGAMIYNRNTYNIQTFGQVKKIEYVDN